MLTSFVCLACDCQVCLCYIRIRMYIHKYNSISTCVYIYIYEITIHASLLAPVWYHTTHPPSFPNDSYLLNCEETVGAGNSNPEQTLRHRRLNWWRLSSSRSTLAAAIPTQRLHVAVGKMRRSRRYDMVTPLNPKYLLESCMEPKRIAIGRLTWNPCVPVLCHIQTKSP